MKLNSLKSIIVACIVILVIGFLLFHVNSPEVSRMVLRGNPPLSISNPPIEIDIIEDKIPDIAANRDLLVSNTKKINDSELGDTLQVAERVAAMSILSIKPTALPTAAPTIAPTTSPTASPTLVPTIVPSSTPTARPSVNLRLSLSSFFDENIFEKNISKLESPLYPLMLDNHDKFLYHSMSLNDRSNDKQSDQSDKSFVELFQKVLRTGRICEEALDSDDSLYLTLRSIYSSSFSVGTFIEHSSIAGQGLFAKGFAKNHPFITTILVETHSASASSSILNDDLVPIEKDKSLTAANSISEPTGTSAAHCSSMRNPVNLYITSRPLPRWKNSVRAVQVIHDLRDLVEDRLPFEFEEYFGGLICSTWLLILPKEIPMVPYFSYWNTLPNLIEKSLKSLPPNSRCPIIANPSGNYSEMLAKIRYSHHVILNNQSLSEFSQISAVDLMAMKLSDDSFSSLYSTMISSSYFLDFASNEHNASSWKIFGSVVNISDNFDASMARSRRIKQSHIPKSKYSLTPMEETSNGNVHRRRLMAATSISRQSPSQSVSAPSINDIGIKVFHTSVFDTAKNIFESIHDENSLSGYETKIETKIESNADSHGEMDQQSRTSLKSANWKSFMIDTNARNLQSTVVDLEYSIFHHWISFLKEEKLVLDLIRKSNVVALYGRSISLLSARLAKFLHKQVIEDDHCVPLVLSCFTDSRAVDSHLRLLSSQGIENNIPFDTSFRLAQWTSFALDVDSKLLVDVSIVQIDVFFSLLGQIITSEHDASDDKYCGDLMDEILGSLLSIAKTTVIEIPTISTVMDFVNRTSSSKCYKSLAEKYVNVHELFSSAIAKISLDAAVQLQYFCNSGYFEASDYEGYIQNEVCRVKVTIAPLTDEKSVEDAPKPSCSRLSLYSLLHLGIASVFKRQMLQLLLDLPIWSLSSQQVDEMLPWTLFFSLRKNYGSLHWTLDYFAMKTSQDDIVKDITKPLIRSVAGSLGSSEDVTRSQFLWKVLKSQFRQAEILSGKFSFVEHNSGYGYFSSRLAKDFPNATIVALEKDVQKVNHHVQMLKKFNISNVAICQKTASDESIFKNIYESPELFRFQLISHGLFESFVDSKDLSTWGTQVGEMLSSALTSFLVLPSSSQVSFAMTILFGGIAGTGIDRDHAGPYRQLVGSMMSNFDRTYHYSSHPLPVYVNFESKWLLTHAKVKGGNTEIMLTPLYYHSSSSMLSSYPTPIYRCDVISMTRHVHHHYDYSLDGHSRTYTMHIGVNESLTQYYKEMFRVHDLSVLSTTALNSGGIRLALEMQSRSQQSRYLPRSAMYAAASMNFNDSSSNSLEDASMQMPLSRNELPFGYHINNNHVVSVHLMRDKDNFSIPYTTIYGITLISVLRMGLIDDHRESMFSSFLRLSLFEDMAPWNIVVMGSTVDYIDYDTRDFTFDRDIPKIYQLMTVLMNYERTVKDFRKCGSKAGTIYGLPYVSDCVHDSSVTISCPDLKLPVPCGDGQCHSDYISCLRSLSGIIDKAISPGQTYTSLTVEKVENQLSWSFNEQGLVK